MNQQSMTACLKCGGAIFRGSGAVGWGGQFCHCGRYAQPADQRPQQVPFVPQFPPTNQDLMNVMKEILEELKKINYRVNNYEDPL